MVRSNDTVVLEGDEDVVAKEQPEKVRGIAIWGSASKDAPVIENTIATVVN